MSEILIGTNPDKPQVVGSIDLEATNEEKARQLPKPSGYRILCAIPDIEKEYETCWRIPLFLLHPICWPWSNYLCKKKEEVENGV